MMCDVGAVRVKASASRATDAGVRFSFAQGLFRVESFQRLNNWHSCGYLARRLAL